jgi:hypothetical protein
MTVLEVMCTIMGLILTRRGVALLCASSIPEPEILRIFDLESPRHCKTVALETADKFLRLVI